MRLMALYFIPIKKKEKVKEKYLLTQTLCYKIFL